MVFFSGLHCIRKLNVHFCSIYESATCLRLSCFEIQYILKWKTLSKNSDDSINTNELLTFFVPSTSPVAKSSMPSRFMNISFKSQCSLKCSLDVPLPSLIMCQCPTLSSLLKLKDRTMHVSPHSLWLLY